MAITENNTEKTVSEDQNGAKRKKLWERVNPFLQSGKGRMILCACAAVLVLLTVVLAIMLTRPSGEDPVPELWPAGELMEGIRPPEQGRIDSVRQTEESVTVYFEEFPESALAPYLQTLGAEPAGETTYIAKKGEDRILAVIYDPVTKRLSLTVTSTM